MSEIKLDVLEYKYWTIQLHENQCYLGRCKIICKRDVIDFFDITEEEKEEFFEIGRELKKALIKLFKPDLFNYGSLGNVNPRLHIHVVPRYKDKRVFEGFTFKDNRWGENYAPWDGNFNIPDELMIKLRDKVREILQRGNNKLFK